MPRAIENPPDFRRRSNANNPQTLPQNTNRRNIN